MPQHLLRAYYVAGTELIHLDVFPHLKRAKLYHISSQITRRKGGSAEAQAYGMKLGDWLGVHGLPAQRTSTLPSLLRGATGHSRLRAWLRSNF